MRLEVKKDFASKRLDLFLLSVLKSEIDISRSALDLAIPNFVTLNEKVVKKGVKLKEGDIVDVDLDGIKGKLVSEIEDDIIPVPFDLDIIEETENYIVLNKPQGVAVHPGKDNTNNTVANYLKYYLQSKNEYDESIKRAGIVHRLDKGVGGILLCAKNSKTQRELQTKFENRQVVKLYVAKIEPLKQDIFESELKLEEAIKAFKDNEYQPDEGWIKAEGKIARSRADRRKMVLGSIGKESISYILPISDGRVLVNILTGRMHQIRATLKSLGWVVRGDILYGSKDNNYPEDVIDLKQILLRIEIDGVVKEWSLA